MLKTCRFATGVLGPLRHTSLFRFGCDSKIDAAEPKVDPVSNQIVGNPLNSKTHPLLTSASNSATM
jgi:hypothetical protein